MGRIILAIFLLANSLVTSAQHGPLPPLRPSYPLIGVDTRLWLPIPGYTKINSRYEWLAGAFDSGLHVPQYCGVPSGVRGGVWVADGAIAMDTCNHDLYIYSGGSWRLSAFGFRFGYPGEDYRATDNDRNFSGIGNYQFTFDSLLAYYAKGSTGNTRMFYNSTGAGINAPDSSTGFNIAVSNSSARMYNPGLQFILNSDSGSVNKRISYTSNIHSTFTDYSLITKKYADSVAAAGGGGTITGSGVANRVTWWDAATNITSTSGFTFDGTNILSIPTLGKYRIGTQQMMFLPNQSTFLGSSYYGNGGNNLAFTGGIEGGYNTAVGYFALDSNTRGYANTAVGANAAKNTTTGFYITAIGTNALLSNKTGSELTAVGLNALYSNTSGDFNTAVGASALLNNTTGQTNTAIGNLAMQLNTTGLQNTATGYRAMQFNTSGFFNTGTGYRVMELNTTGTHNTASGNTALGVNTIGKFNSAFGMFAGNSNDTGHYNLYLGYSAGYNGSSQKVDAQYSIGLGAFAYTTANKQFAVSDSINRLTFTGVSRGTANYVLTDSLGDGQYWVGRPIGAATSVPISSLTAATGTNTINNGNFGQEWQWNSLVNEGFILSSSSTAASSSGQVLLEVALSGTNASSARTTYAAQISNTHDGTTSTNVGLFLSAINGTSANYALIVPNNSGSVGIGNNAPSALLSLGTAGSQLGNMSFAGNTSGTVTLQPAAAAGTWTMTLPTNDGDASQVLTTDGSGVTSWATPSGGGLTIGTTTITGATSGNLLYNNAGVLGQYTKSGTGTEVAMTGGPTFTANTTVTTGASTTFTVATSAGAASAEVLIEGAAFTRRYLNNNSSGTFSIQDGARAQHLTILSSGNVGINNTSPTTKLEVSGRFAVTQGADVASANNLVLGTDGNIFEITGTTQINLISNSTWVNGSEITLLFTSTPTVKNGQTTSSNNITILLAGAADFVASSNDVLTLVLTEIGGTQAWREKSRSVN